jgi:hypothetical protein
MNQIGHILPLIIEHGTEEKFFFLNHFTFCKNALQEKPTNMAMS